MALRVLFLRFPHKQGRERERARVRERGRTPEIPGCAEIGDLPGSAGIKPASILASCDQWRRRPVGVGDLVGLPSRGRIVRPLAIDFQPFRLTFRIRAE